MSTLISVLPVTITTIVSRSTSKNNKVLVTGKLDNNQFVSLWVPSEANVKVGNIVYCNNVTAIVATIRFSTIDAVLAFVAAVLALVGNLADLNNALSDKTAESPFAKLFWIQQMVYCEFITIDDMDTEYPCGGNSNNTPTSAQQAKIEQLKALLGGTVSETPKVASDVVTTDVAIKKPTKAN